MSDIPDVSGVSGVSGVSAGPWRQGDPLVRCVVREPDRLDVTVFGVPYQTPPDFGPLKRASFGVLMDRLWDTLQTPFSVEIIETDGTRQTGTIDLSHQPANTPNVSLPLSLLDSPGASLSRSVPGLGVEAVKPVERHQPRHRAVPNVELSKPSWLPTPNRSDPQPTPTQQPEPTQPSDRLFDWESTQQSNSVLKNTSISRPVVDSGLVSGPSVGFETEAGLERVAVSNSRSGFEPGVGVGLSHRVGFRYQSLNGVGFNTGEVVDVAVVIAGVRADQNGEVQLELPSWLMCRFTLGEVVLVGQVSGHSTKVVLPGQRRTLKQ